MDISSEINTNREETQSQFTATNENVNEQTAHMQLQSGIDQNRQLSEHNFAAMSQQLDRQDKSNQGNTAIENSRESTRAQVSENRHSADMNQQHGLIEQNIVTNRDQSRQAFDHTQNLQSLSESRQAAKQSNEHTQTMQGQSENRQATQSQFQGHETQSGERETRMTDRQVNAENNHAHDMKGQHENIEQNIYRNRMDTNNQFLSTNSHVSRNHADAHDYRRNHRVITRLRDQDQMARLTQLQQENEAARQRLAELANRNFASHQKSIRSVVPNLRRVVSRQGVNGRRRDRRTQKLQRRLFSRHVSQVRRDKLHGVVRNLSRRQRKLSRWHQLQQERRKRYNNIIEHFRNAAIHRRKMAARQRRYVLKLRKFVRILARRQRVLQRKLERRQDSRERHKRMEMLQRRSEKRLQRGMDQRQQHKAPLRAMKSLFSLKDFVKNAQQRTAKRLHQSFSNKFRSLARIVKRYKRNE